MRFHISDSIGVVGIFLILGPWIFFDDPGLGAWIISCLGCALAAIGRANALSVMLRRGPAGDELIKDCWIKIKRLFRLN